MYGTGRKEEGMCFEKVIGFKECGPIYEIDVFHADHQEYILSASKDQPVHLWSLSDKKIRTQYVCRN